MKYDTQLAELKTLLPNSKNILIALPANASIDTLASGLALFLTLEAAGKQATVACDDNILVGQAHLFGVDHIQKTLPSVGGGNLTLTLEGVAASDNTIPALEKLDWYAENNNLNLVFHVLPGQTFQPAKIVPRFQGSGFNLIFVVGAVNLNALGNVYALNSQAFSGTHIVNIDNGQANTSFASTNVIDASASSVAEIMTSVIMDLGFMLSADCASNLLAGVFDATGNLTNEKATAETYMAVANCLRVGGRKPSVVKPLENTPQQPAYDWNALMPKDPNAANAQSIPQAVQPVASIPVVDQGDHQAPVYSSPEERPSGERIASESIEPEWLTPKIFKGSSVG